MEIKFNMETILGMLLKYYEEEGKKVEVNITRGKVITPVNYFPVRIAISFEINEKTEINGLIESEKKILSEEDIQRMLSHVLLSANFAAASIDFEIDKNTAQPIAKITGTKVNLNKTF